MKSIFIKKYHPQWLDYKWHMFNSFFNDPSMWKPTKLSFGDGYEW